MGRIGWGNLPAAAAGGVVVGEVLDRCKCGVDDAGVCVGANKGLGVNINTPKGLVVGGGGGVVGSGTWLLVMVDGREKGIEETSGANVGVFEEVVVCVGVGVISGVEAGVGMTTVAHVDASVEINVGVDMGVIVGGGTMMGT